MSAAYECPFCHGSWPQVSTCIGVAEVEEVVYQRIPYRPDYKGPGGTCHDCGAAWGGYHHPGCDMEDCPRCLEQAIVCGCRWAGDDPANLEHPNAQRAQA